MFNVAVLFGGERPGEAAMMPPLIIAEGLTCGVKEHAGRAEAITFLSGALAGPRLARDLFQTAEAQGISSATLRRAKKLLSIQAIRDGFGRHTRQQHARPSD